MRKISLLALLFSAAPAIALAQSAPPAPSGYGTEDLQVVNVTFDRFLPLGSSVDFASNCCQQGLAGERWIVESTGGVLLASIDAGLVPNGADLVDVSFYVLDTQAALPVDISGRLCRSWVDVDGGDLDGDCPLLVSTSGGPGDTVIGGDPNIQVRYQFDVDADGEEEVVSHFLWVFFSPSDVPGQIRLRSARLLFRRQISPAPALATFGDVPPSHPFFQFVEALATSGITAGCGSGNYCPDAALTRGQMAVFLAKALGLHWPGPEVP